MYSIQKFRIFLASTVLVLAVSAAVPAPAQNTVRSAREQNTGDQNHPKIMAQHGGAITNRQVADYVAEVGNSLVRYSSQPGAKWTFTVLDTPVVNAFAIPGGYVYVTRGLLALANDEAELAGVLGHEIGHITAGHVASRREKSNEAGAGVLLGAVIGGLLGGKDGLRQGLELTTRLAAGYVAHHSQKQEFAADRIGVRILARAGYDPFAQADFLDNMAEKARLDARLAGKAYNPNAVSFFASHPATGERVRRAIGEARTGGERMDTDVPRKEEQYMLVIDGLDYGDSREQGLVRGRSFSHPILRFAYHVPDGFHITNSAASVTARGPNKSRMILEGHADNGGRLDRYISRNWASALAKKYRTGKLTGLKQTRINRLEAATASVSIRVGSENMVLQMAAIRHNGQIYRLSGLTRTSDKKTRRALADALGSFRALSKNEAARLQSHHLQVHVVSSGDTVSRLARRMNVEAFSEDHFRTLNGYDDGNPMRRGDLVKLVVD